VAETAAYEGAAFNDNQTLSFGRNPLARGLSTGPSGVIRHYRYPPLQLFHEGFINLT